MSVTLRLYNGYTSLTLSSTSGYIEEYPLGSADLSGETVGESIRCTLIGGNAVVEQTMRDIERMFVQARERQYSKAVSPVYLMLNIDGVDWRSEIVNGRIDSGSQWIKAERALGQREISLIIERKNWWEKPIPTDVSLSNPHGSGTSGVTVYNHEDAVHKNYVDLGTVNGDLPTPIILEATGAGLTDYGMMVGLAAYADVANLVTRFEGESLTALTGVTRTLVADTNCSGGSYGQLDWSAQYATNLGYWSLSTTETGAYRGRAYRAALRFVDVPSYNRYWLQWGAYVSSPPVSYFLTEGVVLTATNMMILPVLQLPPWPVDGGSDSVYLGLRVYKGDSGAATLKLDVMQLLPADGFLDFAPMIAGYGAFSILYDQALGVLKQSNLSSGSHQVLGPGIELIPGRAMRLCFLFYKSDGNWDISKSATIKVSYRERKRIIQ